MQRVSSALEAGMVGVNDVAISAPEAPFGGYKTSGIGKTKFTKQMFSDIIWVPQKRGRNKQTFHTFVSKICFFKEGQLREQVNLAFLADASARDVGVDPPLR